MTTSATPSEYSPDYVPPTPDLRTYRNGAGVEAQAVQLTKANMRAVYEWADSKQYFDNNPTGKGLIVTGLTIFTGTGRQKANVGDWVVRWPSGNFDRYDAPRFGQSFAEVQS